MRGRVLHRRDEGLRIVPALNYWNLARYAGRIHVVTSYAVLHIPALENVD